MIENMKAAKGDGCYHRAAEAMRRGCILRPRKVKKHFWHDKDGACALGAVIATVGERSPILNYFDAIVRLFPELNNIVDDPLTGFPESILLVINELNEDTDFSREEIADWLCQLGGCEHPLGFIAPTWPIWWARPSNRGGPLGPASCPQLVAAEGAEGLRSCATHPLRNAPV